MRHYRVDYLSRRFTPTNFALVEPPVDVWDFSFPFMRLAKKWGKPYGEVVRMAQRIQTYLSADGPTSARIGESIRDELEWKYPGYHREILETIIQSMKVMGRWV